MHIRGKFVIALSLLLHIGSWWGFWGEQGFPWGWDARRVKREKEEGGLGRGDYRKDTNMDSRNGWEKWEAAGPWRWRIKAFLWRRTQTLFSNHRTTGEKTKPEGKAGVVPEKEWKDCKWRAVRQSKICKLLISVSVYMAILSGVFSASQY